MPAARGILRRFGVDSATTPGRLWMLLVILVILTLAWGVVATLAADQHASAAAEVVAVSEPLSLDAEQIYQSLSDADATAANAFLSGGLSLPRPGSVISLTSRRRLSGSRRQAR